MYTIRKKTENNIQSINIKSNKGEYFEILPSYGGNINKLFLKKEKLYSILKIKEKEIDFLNKAIFNGAKLFPFTNRLAFGKYTFENTQYLIEKNYSEENNACHGFIYKKEFKITEKKVTNDYAEVTLSYLYTGDIPGYPFLFKIDISYSLCKNEGFICSTKVINYGKKAMPFGDGWHPFIEISECVNHLFLKFQSEKVFEVNNRLIPNGKTKKYNLFKSNQKIGDATFDNCFALCKDGGIHSTEIYNASEDLTVVLWQETGNNKYNYLQLYTPPERNCIAIEPMTCAPDCFNNKEGLLILESGDIFEAKFGIKIK